ncbi:VgrG protein [Rubrivivax sp. A210]|uniref:type VI secretion system Vgr family protein n=1 Tax=Rubrivivax sp. A210 TaxID=2772301 RepID=UPI001917ED79|nr:type VI secretion system tip protein TssI/VgrG [Rubrivivax sp. A210]CAD5369304.1 VgrG protein [Rubrivivax sp. A210]
MNESFKAELKLPPGSTALDLYTFEGHEALSRLYGYSAVALGKLNETVDFEALLGKPAEVVVSDEGGSPRSYHGIIAGVAYDGVVARRPAYRLELVPWLWLATRGANVRVFQNQTVVDIIEKVILPYEPAFQNEVKGNLAKRAYCVQYRETDFNFISRLLEEEGLFYFFRHSAGKHEMVLANLPGVHVNEHGLKALPYHDNARQRSEGAVVTHWRWSHQIQTGKVAVRDHHFMLPAQTFEKMAEAEVKHPHGKIQLYDHDLGLPPHADDPLAPADLQTLPPMAEAIAKRRLEAHQALRVAADGRTSALRLCAGARFTLEGHPEAGQNAEHIVHSTHVRIRIAGYESGAAKESIHECDFTAFPSTLVFRPGRLTPKPRAPGPQTATVVGPAGEEIFVDKYGRVKVQFHWDREGKKDAGSSCWVRVAQPSAGKSWGVVMLPRIGQEVVVDFIEGDPDQPLVTGGVYNAENMPPYTLPDNKTVSTIKTNSSMGGGGFNELKFEDKKGSELLYLQAQKDRTELVKNDSKTDVGNNLTLTIKKDRSETVSEGKYDLTVKKAITTKTDDVYSLTAVKDVSTDTQANVKVTAKQAVKVDATTEVEISAKTKITLKCGGSQIELTPAGITIKGSLVTAEAQGLMTVKGALVKVN